jgi:predicted Zn finger-like uncharacterized protein
MFTVCPKCALTLVVTAQDLRVAQGYVRCGRCSNVFNAIVALTDDRGVPQSPPGGSSGAGAGSQGTATTSIIRKAPSIADEPPIDPVQTTGETEALYAEPDPGTIGLQPSFSDSPRQAPPDSARPTGPISFVAPPPGPPTRAGTAPPPAPKKADGEKRYSDTEGIEPDGDDEELEFNPDRTDLSKVFVEATPVAFRNNAATGTFEKIVLGSPPPQSAQPGASAKPAAPSPGMSSSPVARATATPSPSPAVRSPSPASPSPVRADPGSASLTSAAPKPAAPPPKPAAPREPSLITPSVTAARTPTRPNGESSRIESDLQSLAARLDSTGSRPVPGKPFAANDEALVADAADDDELDTGDIYSRAKARPRPPPPPEEPEWALSDDLRSELQPAPNSEIEAVGVDSFASSPPRRSRMMLWVAGAAVLSVALAAQAVHHNRHDLATSALLNRPLTRLYDALGVPLVPNWDLRAYDVRQLGASIGEAGQGTLTVRASLKNGAAQSRPLPLLRITMQDRYGNRVATRDVQPKDYMPGAVPDGAVLGAGQRVDAEMTFKDPGQNAVGFEIDACLPMANGRIACANDDPTVR